ncbi:intestinal mucin-like protein [Leucoraja erinacea]|uniref:intestinal mucin-like protein n=1 Tax=Leucoraja erinaceus TaxID=7782 RepID=UPI0024547848|nr:intestinal mucin-like protein [Leucoraja erinacea]
MSPFTTPTTVEECVCETTPRRKCNETWTTNCKNYICLVHGIIRITNITCPEIRRPICRDRKSPVKIITHNGCCHQFECVYECKIWGDPHYRTFHGINYDFFGNCTYTAVEEIIPKYNFSVLVDNYYCIEGIPKSCPKQLIIFYKENIITISPTNNKLTVNGHDTKIPYFTKEFNITEQWPKTHISIPEILTNITAADFLFTISIAESFLTNTRGQCGKCSRRNGTDVSSKCCSTTASEWIYNDIKKPYCQGNSTSVPPCEVTPTSTPCPYKHPICDLITGKPFVKCRRKVDIEHFKKTCIYDNCGTNVICNSLEAAADECFKLGFCVNWRPYTNGLCNHTCPHNLVYKACPSKTDDRCVNSTVEPGTHTSEEGCFCPDGMMMTENSTECVSSCESKLYFSWNKYELVLITFREIVFIVRYHLVKHTKVFLNNIKLSLRPS